MTTPTTPKKTSSAKKRATPKTKSAQSRTRRTMKQPAAADDAVNESARRRVPSNTRSLAGQSEQLIILVVALGFGLIGLAIHFLWIVSIVLMALLVGLIGAEARRQRGHGLVAEVVAEARAVADDIGTPVPGSDNESAHRSPPEVESRTS